MVTQEKPLHTLIPLAEFKAVVGIDDRDDKTAQFCLVTSTLSIEQYCMRRLLKKKIFERLEYAGDLLLPLREYPVASILAVFANGEIVEPEFYGVVPDCGTVDDIPFSLTLSPALVRYQKLTAIKAVYVAGYPFGKIPADLSAACMELASWNFSRYKGRHIGVATKNDRLEMSMPENVQVLLAPYRRKTI